MNADATVAYTNRQEFLTPKGIVLDVWSYALFVLLIFGGVITFLAVCSKKRHNNLNSKNYQF